MLTFDECCVSFLRNQNEPALNCHTVYAVAQPDETPLNSDVLLVHAWFLPGPEEDTATWWRSCSDSRLLGYWRDKLTQVAARHPESHAITLVGCDGDAFMGFVRDVPFVPKEV